METNTENTARTSAILMPGSEEVSAMLESEVLYLASLSAAKSMLKKGLISRKEFTEIDTILRRKFAPTLSLFLSENA